MELEMNLSIEKNYFSFLKYDDTFAWIIIMYFVYLFAVNCYDLYAYIVTWWLDECII